MKCLKLCATEFRANVWHTLMVLKPVVAWNSSLFLGGKGEVYTHIQMPQVFICSVLYLEFINQCV